LPSRLSWDKVSFLAFVVALVVRAHATLMLPDLPPDKLRQLSTARQWAEGNGVTMAYAHTDDLANFNFVPVGVWPPGYAILVGTLLKLNVDYVEAAIIADLVGVSSFFFGLFLLVRIFKPYVNPFFSILLFIYFSVAYSPFRLIFSTDLLSLGFFVSSFALMLHMIVKAPDMSSVKKYFLAFVVAVLAFLCSFFRFSYYPLSFAIPFIMLLYGMLKVNALRKPALLSFGALILFIFLLLSYQKLVANNLNYLTDYHPEQFNHFQFQNLIKFDPVLANAFLPVFQLKKVLGYRIALGMVLFISGFVAVAIFQGPIAVLVNQLRRKAIEISPISVFYSTGLILCAVNIFFITVLSLRFHPLPVEWTSDGLWTYVQETRYFAPTLTFIILFVLTIAFYSLIGNKIISTLAKAILFLAFSFSTVTYIYYLKKYSWLDPSTNMRQFYHLSQDLPAFLKRYNIQEAPEPVVFVSNNQEYTIDLLFSIEGAALLDGTRLIKTPVRTSAPVRLLIAVDQHRKNHVDQKLYEFSVKHGAQLISVIDDINTEVWELKVGKTL
jgi:hypothetical protein